MQILDIKKILIIRTGAIGDVVHTTNLYRSIKRQNPETEIHYLTSDLIKPLLEADVDISKIITIPKKIKLFSSETKELIKKINNENYDVVFNLQPSLKTRLIIMLSNIKKQAVYKKNFKVHAVKNFWQTGLEIFPNLKEPNNLKIYLPNSLTNNAKELIKNFKSPVIILNAGGMFSKRQGRTYPVKKWVELADKISEYYGGTFILNGAKEDREFLLPLEKIKNSINYIGVFSLEKACAVISQADLMISGDSGPLHIACALGVKSIGLYGSMPENRTGCYCNGINIVSKKECVPCNRRKCKFLRGTKNIYAPCMEEIKVETIFEQVKILLGTKEIKH